VKASIIDSKVLNALSPLQIAAYLSARGATVRGMFRKRARVWQYGNEEILLPLSRELSDYAVAVHNIFTVIEKIEERSQLQILTDIQHSGYDVIRIRNASDDTATGTLDLMTSVDFVSASRDMLLSAACSAWSNKRRYASRKPQEALNYMDTVRFGQTEYGSFILALLSPVAPVLKQQGVLIDQEEELPYEKKVVPTLNTGLVALNEAAQQASDSGEAGLFMEGSSKGLSANLCDAVVSLHDTARSGLIEVSISYSTYRETPTPVQKIAIHDDYIPIIKEASRTIKNVEPEEDQLILGFVTKLHREPEEELGEITISDISNGKARNIRVKLSREQYSIAVSAHNTQQPVTIEGTLFKNGKKIHLEPSGTLNMLNTVGEV
jgi:hypothetical protein